MKKKENCTVKGVGLSCPKYPKDIKEKNIIHAISSLKYLCSGHWIQKPTANKGKIATKIIAKNITIIPIVFDEKDFKIA